MKMMKTEEGEIKMTDFTILHHSYKLKWASGEKLAKILDEDEINDWQYYCYNLVFRASGELKEMCMEDTKKWKKGRVCIDTKKYDEYLNGLEINWNKKEEIIDGKSYYPIGFKNNSGIDRDSLFVSGYIENFSPFLVYREKFDVFQFREYLQYHPATTGIIQLIEDLKNGRSYGIQASSSQLYSAIKSLEGFWD